MADEIIRTETNLPAAPPLMNVTASGDGTAIGIVQGDVRFELNENSIPFIQRMVGCQQPEFHAAEWALLNEKCFHLFVLENEKYDCGCFSISKRVALTKNTSPEYIEHYESWLRSVTIIIRSMKIIMTIIYVSSSVSHTIRISSAKSPITDLLITNAHPSLK